MSKGAGISVNPVVRMALAISATFGVGACDSEPRETLDKCIERFERLEPPPMLRGNHWVEPIFTYDISRMGSPFETILGRSGRMEGARMVVAEGGAKEALEAFYKSEVPQKGAFFSSDDDVLYRIRGAPGSLESTLTQGCRGTPPEARLIHIDWKPAPRNSEPHAQKN